MMLARRLAHKLPSAASPLVCRSLGCTAHASMRSSAACVRAPHRLLCTMQSKVSSANLRQPRVVTALMQMRQSACTALATYYRCERCCASKSCSSRLASAWCCRCCLSLRPHLADAAEGAVVAAVSGGTIAAAGTMSWYCERIVGELTWRPVSRTLRVSTLTMFGDRRDVDLTAEELSSDGFVEEDEEHTNFLGEDSEDRYPQTSLVPLDMCVVRHTSSCGESGMSAVQTRWPTCSCAGCGRASP